MDVTTAPPVFGVRTLAILANRSPLRTGLSVSFIEVKARRDTHMAW